MLWRLREVLASSPMDDDAKAPAAFPFSHSKSDAGLLTFVQPSGRECNESTSQAVAGNCSGIRCSGSHCSGSHCYWMVCAPSNDEQESVRLY